MSAHPAPCSALAGLRPSVRRMPLENLSSLAGPHFGDPDVLALWFGEGDVAAPAFIGEAMMAAVRAGHVFYTHQNGIPPLRQALSAYLSDLGTRSIDTERVTVTTSGMHAIMLALELIVAPGEAVVVVDPFWPNLAGATGMIGAEARSLRMDYGPLGWTLDLDKVAAALQPGVKALFFASPGNPTGATIPMATQKAVLGLCRERGVWLLVDEVYNRFLFGRRSAGTILDLAEPEDRLIVFNSFSKSWAMTGWRLGWMVHPPSLGRTLAMAIQYSTSGVATFIQHAGVAAVEQGEPFVAFIRDYCARGAEIAHDALARMERVRLGPRPIAGMYVYFQVDGMPDSRAACRDILEKTRVGLAPGVFFGPGSESFLRICVSREAASLTEAMSRLERVFR